MTSLSGLYIDETFPRLVQTDATRTQFADGLGNSISFGQTPTGSLLLTASAVGNTITFTKGDGSQFPVTVTGGTVTGDYVTTSSFNAFTGSVTTTSSFNNFTSSVVTTSSFNSFTSSVITTSSFNSFTSSVVTTSSFNSFTSSINNFTASSANTTGSNDFNGNQTITGSLSQGLAGNIATGEYSHAEGSITKAIGNYSHAEGDNTQTIGDYSHAEGQETIASGSYSHAEGYNTIASASWQHVQGQWNAISSIPAAFIVGNGTDNNNRSNLIYAYNSTVDISGSLNVTGSIKFTALTTSSIPLTNILMLSSSGQVFITASSAIGGGGSGTPVAILDEGTQLTPSVTSINFTGAGVAATNVGNAVTVTINGTSVDTSTFATTGSNIFKGNQTVTGSLFTTGSNTLIGTTTLTGSLNITGSTTQIGNIVITGSLTVTQNISASSFTGSLFGTATTASYVTASAIVGTVLSASYAQTSSYVVTALTASYVTSSNVVGTVLSASYALTASYVSSNFQYEIHVSQVDGNDTTGDGSLLKPVATITKGLTLVGSQRKTIIVHPGTYTESPSITVQYTTISGPGLIGGNIVINGTVSTNNGCTISGIKMTNLIITTPAGAGNVNILNCEISGTLTKNSNADYTVLRLCDYGVANITGGGLVAIFGGNPNFTTVNNASANVIIKSAVTVAPVLTAGTLSLVDSVVVAAVTNAVTSTASSVITIANCQLLTSALNNVAPVVLNGFYSILNCVFDKPTSTLVALSATGGSTNSVDYFQYIDADNITTKGVTISGSLNITGSTTQIGNIVITGSLTVTQNISASSFTGSLFGTATTASYITSSFFTGINAALSASYATTASYAANIPSLKASSASVASFSGTPKSSSITFASSFPNNSYAVTVTGEDARSWTIQSKTSAGFTINSNSTVALTGPVYWIATPFN
jgi:hypothetical protein